MNPLISAVIPVYNRPRLAAEALDSILAQDYSSFEIIIADDGSDDATPGVLTSFREKANRLRPDVRVEILTLPHSGMPGLARNRGVEAARGEYVAFLDSDDLWLPEKLSTQASFRELHPELKIFHTREVWRRGEKTVSQKGMKHRREGDIFSDALEKCIIGPSTVMIESALFRESGGFHEALEVAEDFEYWLRLTSRYPVGYLEDPLTVKRAGGWDQLSEKYGQIEIFRIKALEAVMKGHELPEKRRVEAEAVYARKCGIYAAGCLKRGKIEEALEYEAKAGGQNAD